MKFFNNRQFVCTLTALFLSLQGISQASYPVQWDVDVKRVSETEIEIKATATMQPGWVIYSQFTEEGGPIPITFTLQGQTTTFEEKTSAIREFDTMFDAQVIKFKNTAVFTKRHPVEKDRTIQLSVDFMTCDGSRCLPPKEISFTKSYSTD